MFTCSALMPAGPLPAEWSALRAARSIMLQSNALNGTVPANWSGLPSIQILSLGANTIQVSMQQGRC